MKTKRDGTKYNPNVGQGFTNDKFGKGSIKIDLDAEGIAEFVANAKVGSALLIKFNKVTAVGNSHYFCELLPPFTKELVQTRAKETETKKTTNGTELG